MPAEEKNWKETNFIMLRNLCLSLILISICYAQQTSRQLNDKVDQLNEWSLRRPVIRMDTAKFNKYIRESPRNYSVIVMFTALKPQRNCMVCKQASDEFSILANSFWATSGGNSDLYFTLIDYDDANEVFNQMKLQTAPVFMHFPSKGKPKKSDTFELHRYGFDAEVLSRFVLERTGVQFRVFRPPNYMMNLLVLTALAMLAGVIYFKRDSLDFLFQRTTWAGITISFILVMMSGQMWNQIRGAGFAHRDQRTGQVHYIHSSSQGQFIAETYIVMFLHGAVALGMILINEACTNKALNNAHARKIVAAIGLVLVAIFFSALLAIFRGKYGGYPYKFLL